MKILKALVYHKQLTSLLGGGTFLPLKLVAELQKTCDVTLALNGETDIRAVAAMSGVAIDAGKLRVVKLDRDSPFLAKREWLASLLRQRRLKKLAKDADVCVSTANVMDFGKKAHHFVYLLSQFGGAAFYDYIMGRRGGFGARRTVRRMQTAVYENVVKPAFGIRPLRKIVASERIYPASQYVEDVLRGYFGAFESRVFWPPTVFEFDGANAQRDPLLAIYVGRIFPPKRLTELVEAVEKARALSGKDLKFKIAGVLAPIPYTDTLKKLAAERPWLELCGPVYGEDKKRFMSSATYALHAERDEAFGIAIAEYLKAGCIPIVPDVGGPREIVGDRALEFRTVDGAAEILARLVGDERFREERRRHCAGRAAEFSRESYETRQRAVVEEMLKP
ncbi:MAG: glycosyltransferase [Kiritimatiellae bacterium]|nr:glycosyltransferase [Kiritimatiellia bacterium]